MATEEVFVFSAARASERGLPPIELRFRRVEGLDVGELPPALEGGSGALLRGEERAPDGRLVGWIEMALFSASLVIDRAGELRDIARAGAQVVLAGPERGRLLGEVAVELGGGAGGERIDLLLQLDEEGLFRPECPYASCLALAGDVMLRGGVSVLVRSAGPDWAAATALLESLEIAGPGGSAPGGTGRLELPFTG